MKYKVGDRVKIREDLDTDKIYGDWDCSKDMARCGGKIATIVKCCDDSYHIDVDNKNYNWTDEMFEDNTVVESEDDVKAKTVDIGYHLEHCGHRLIKNVYIDGYDDDSTYLYCVDIEETVQYKLPTDSIEFIIPHEVD